MREPGEPPMPEELPGYAPDEFPVPQEPPGPSARNRLEPGQSAIIAGDNVKLRFETAV